MNKILDATVPGGNSGSREAITDDIKSGFKDAWEIADLTQFKAAQAAITELQTQLEGAIGGFLEPYGVITINGIPLTVDGVYLTLS